jgi:hypothetical protein
MDYNPKKYQVLSRSAGDVLAGSELLVETRWYWYACFRGWLHVTWNPDRLAVVAKLVRGE